jgi:hypothetical protein
MAESAYGDRETQHVPIKAWLFCGVLSVEDALARNFVLLRRLLKVRLLMRLLTIHRLRRVFAVVNGCCLASLLRSISSLGAVFRGISVLWRSFTLLICFTRCFNRTMTEWLTLILKYICFKHKHILFRGTCNFVSIN